MERQMDGTESNEAKQLEETGDSAAKHHSSGRYDYQIEVVHLVTLLESVKNCHGCFRMPCGRIRYPYGSFLLGAANLTETRFSDDEY